MAKSDDNGQEHIDRARDLEELRDVCERYLGDEVAEGERLVFGAGSPKARLLFVGEAPGREEARSGKPFVGNAGRRLNKLLDSIGLRREEVYIVNVLKTRPPGNRAPTRTMVRRHLPFLKRQILLVRPERLVLLGRTALQALVGPEAKITRERGTWKEVDGIPALVTLHPAAVFHDETKSALLEDDFAQLRECLEAA